MRGFVLGIAAGLGLLTSSAMAGPILDGVRLTSGGRTVEWTSTVEGGLASETKIALNFAATPRGFRSGLVILTDPDGSISDEFALFSIRNRLSAIFLSDPFILPPSIIPLRSITVPETGKWQSFGNFFGARDNDAVQIISDLDVPEPASLAVLGLALTGIGMVRRRR